MKSKLKDIAKVKFIGGKGGDGIRRFGPTKLPMGGNGGNGGNIFLKGNRNLYDLSHINNDTIIQGNNGEIGGENNRTGRNGEDIIFEVPLITRVYDGENLLFSVDDTITKHLIVSGGRGGLGNHFFKAGQLLTLDKTTKGFGGDEKSIKLELNLKADVIFIGLPNAGKSSIINELTNANSKIGSYAFTTIEPVLGNMNGIVLMDLPGLIENTFQGKGLGTKFLKHALNAKVILHFLSLESENINEDYLLIRGEIEKMNETLGGLPEFIVLNKSDLATEEKALEIKNSFEKKGKKVFITSAYNLDQINNLKQGLTKYFKEQS